MPPKWDVEYALEEVVQAIQKGSLLKVPDDVRIGYKARYRDDFKAQYKAGADWDKDKVQVLPRAKLVGALAATMTIAKAVLKFSQPPDKVDANSAYLAGFLIAHGLYCPADTDEEILGHYCQGYPRGGLHLTDDQPAMLALAAAFLTLVASVEVESARVRRRVAKSASGGKEV
jgi:hypothetical protein